MNVLEDFVLNFSMKGKNNYSWNLIQMNKTENSEIYIYCGTNRLDNNDIKIVKQIKIDKDKFEDKEYIYHILKEFNLFFSLKIYNYFLKEIFILISEDENYLYLIINENVVSLKKLILSKIYNYLDNKYLVKWIIYQITFGLHILHSNNIIHHDIKLSNIFIDSEGGIKINGFESAIFKNQKSYQYTLPYSAPEILIGNIIIDEKIDIWSLGIIIIELYLKKDLFLYKKDIKNREDQLYLILEMLYGIKKEKFSINDLINILNGNINNNIEFKIEQKILDQIQDKDAIFLLNHLLNFNPKERFTAKQILNSDYLKEFNGIDSLNIKPIEFIIDNDEISKNKLEKQNFIELIKNIICK